MSSSISLDEALEVLVVSMRDAFLAVTVFVAVMVLLFSWLQYITAGKFVDWIRKNQSIQPLIGALMGLTPGCGGAIIVMPMYTRGYVTYGTVIATLIATLGDDVCSDRGCLPGCFIPCTCNCSTSDILHCRSNMGLCSG